MGNICTKVKTDDFKPFGMPDDLNIYSKTISNKLNLSKLKNFLLKIKGLAENNEFIKSIITFIENSPSLDNLENYLEGILKVLKKILPAIGNVCIIAGVFITILNLFINEKMLKKLF